MAPDCSVLVSFEAGERLCCLPHPAPANRQQRDDISRLQRRVRPVSDIQLVKRARDRDIDGDPARLRLQIQIEHRLDLYRVEEADFAAIDAIARAEYADISLIGGQASEQNRMIGCAAQLQIDLGLHIAAQSGAELEVRRALDGYVEMQPAQETAIARGVAVALLKDASSGPTSVFVLKTTREIVSVPERMLLLLVPLRRSAELAVTLMLPAVAHAHLLRLSFEMINQRTISSETDKSAKRHIPAARSRGHL